MKQENTVTSETIKLLRGRLGWSTAELSKALGRAPSHAQTVLKYEKGQVKPVGDTLLAIALITRIAMRNPQALEDGADNLYEELLQISGLDEWLGNHTTPEEAHTAHTPETASDAPAPAPAPLPDPAPAAQDRTPPLAPVAPLPDTPVVAVDYEELAAVVQAQPHTASLASPDEQSDSDTAGQPAHTPDVPAVPTQEMPTPALHAWAMDASTTDADLDIMMAMRERNPDLWAWFAHPDNTQQAVADYVNSLKTSGAWV